MYYHSPLFSASTPLRFKLNCGGGGRDGCVEDGVIGMGGIVFELGEPAIGSRMKGVLQRVLGVAGVMFAMKCRSSVCSSF